MLLVHVLRQMILPHSPNRAAGIVTARERAVDWVIEPVAATGTNDDGDSEGLPDTRDFRDRKAAAVLETDRIGAIIAWQVDCDVLLLYRQASILEWFAWRDEGHARGRTLLALFDDVARGRIDRSTSRPV
jgi:hypothetical protein